MDDSAGGMSGYGKCSLCCRDLCSYRKVKFDGTADLPCSLYFYLSFGLLRVGDCAEAVEEEVRGQV